ncbi:PREDICTED: F-box protein At1g67130-like [Camelina sativa]|uniref:F-box protein At1g67130-like n=1 Tax=Camelina sativa TaxID=90675 RepID=A0ABM0X4F7_CAMSA|nr:PREDICTED: F-box protein At1g67130-like [Camelina sativa]
MAHYILTLGTEKERWRKIYCPYNEDDQNGGVCINGILYFTVYDCDTRSHLIGCFDVRFEKFKFLDICCQYGLCTLINYKGKLGVIKWKCAGDGGFPLELCMWVLEDLEKQEWSKFAYTLKDDNKVIDQVDYDLSVVGVTASGDIVLVKETAFKPFYVFYFNPERNHLLSVEIQGLGEDHDWSKYHAVCAFVDHVEVNIMRETSLNPATH